MNANLVNILTWSRPAKTTAVLLAINFILWVLIRQRPLCVLPLVVVVWYLRHIWRHRIRGEVLVDPPDHEEWITLSTYDIQHVTSSYLADLFHSWISLRHQNHLLWTVGTVTAWVVLAKIGTEVDFLTLLFLLSNAAFVILPVLEILPKSEASSAQVIQTEDLIPEVPKRSERERRRQSAVSSVEGSPVFGPIPVPIDVPSPQPAFYEGIVTRSISAAAVSLMSSVPSTAVFSSGPMGTIASMAGSLVPLRDSDGPGSLSPAISQMPDHEVVDSDPEDEFMFDAKHFDKSSSSSVSNSFEIIEDDL